MIKVTCAIIFFGDKILVTQRSASMKMPLKWEFPGGKLEEGESEAECIKREIKEEINIEIEIVSRLQESQFDYGSLQIKLIPFIAKYVSGEIKLAEHCDYKMMEVTALLNLDWAEADLPIVQEVVHIIESSNDDDRDI